MKLSRAVDKAVDAENRAFLADPEAQRAAEEYGRLCARVIEAQRRGFVQHPYPEETLEAFCARAGV